MITPDFLHTHPRPSAETPSRARALLISLIAYLSLVVASVVAAIALVGEELPMEVLVTVV